MRTPALPLVISGHAVLGEILRRNKFRDDCERVARRLGFPERNKRIHRAALGPNETVESNLPLR